MPLLKARKDLAAAQLEIEHLRHENENLLMEAGRLRVALTDAKLIAALLEPAVVTVPLPDLAPRDREVLALLIAGNTNLEIGAALFMAPSTVKYHLGNLSKKFESHNRIGTAINAIRAGFSSDQEDQP